MDEHLCSRFWLILLLHTGATGGYFYVSLTCKLKADKCFTTDIHSIRKEPTHAYLGLDCCGGGGASAKLAIDTPPMLDDLL